MLHFKTNSAQSEISCLDTENFDEIFLIKCIHTRSIIIDYSCGGRIFVSNLARHHRSRNIIKKYGKVIQQEPAISTGASNHSTVDRFLIAHRTLLLLYHITTEYLITLTLAASPFWMHVPHFTVFLRRNITVELGVFGNVCTPRTVMTLTQLAISLLRCFHHSWFYGIFNRSTVINPIRTTVFSGGTYE